MGAMYGKTDNSQGQINFSGDTINFDAFFLINSYSFHLCYSKSFRSQLHLGNPKLLSERSMVVGEFDNIL